MAVGLQLTLASVTLDPTDAGNRFAVRINRRECTLHCVSLVKEMIEWQ